MAVPNGTMDVLLSCAQENVTNQLLLPRRAVPSAHSGCCPQSHCCSASVLSPAGKGLVPGRAPGVVVCMPARRDALHTARQAEEAQRAQAA